MITERLPKGVLLQAVYQPGWILFPNGDDIQVGSCMFDTGAFHANYISPAFIREHWQALSPMIRFDPSVTTLADGKTSVRCDQVAILNIAFMEGDQRVSAELPFRVFQMGA